MMSTASIYCTVCILAVVVMMVEGNRLRLSRLENIPFISLDSTLIWEKMQ